MVYTVRHFQHFLLVLQPQLSLYFSLFCLPLSHPASLCKCFWRCNGELMLWCSWDSVTCWRVQCSGCHPHCAFSRHFTKPPTVWAVSRQKKKKSCEGINAVVTPMRAFSFSGILPLFTMKNRQWARPISLMRPGCEEDALIHISNKMNNYWWIITYKIIIFIYFFSYVAHEGQWANLNRKEWILCSQNQTSLCFDSGILNISTGSSHEDNNTILFQWLWFLPESLSFLLQHPWLSKWEKLWCA